MARFTAIRRTDALSIAVATLSFEGEGTLAEFEGAASVISDASYYLGGPRGGIAEAPHVSIVEHGDGPRGGTVVARFDLRSHVFTPRPADAPATGAEAEAAEADFKALFADLFGVAL